MKDHQDPKSLNCSQRESTGILDTVSKKEKGEVETETETEKVA